MRTGVIALLAVVSCSPVLTSSSLSPAPTIRVAPADETILEEWARRTDQTDLLKSFSAKEGIEHFFRGECGTSIARESAEYPDRVDITTGSLGEPERVPPERAVNRRYRVPWASRI